MRKLILATSLLLSLSPAAQAAIFGDDEARKKIGEIQVQNQATQTTLNELKANQQVLEKKIAEIEAIVKGQGMLDMLSKIDSLTQELNLVKGQLEVATHQIETAQQRQKDLYADTDGRLRKLEGGAATPAPAEGQAANGAPAAAEPSADAKDFDAAQALLKSGKYRESFDAHEKFLQTHPTSSFAPEAQYSLGYTQFSLKNYKAAIATQQKMVKQYPDHPKAADALFNVANSQIQLADIGGAKKTLRELVSRYPNSEVTPNAKKRLAVLDSIKK
jgi:tol-pal system protein YbgF